MSKVSAMAVAKVLLLPGLVGLGILDGQALGLPLVTTAVPFHSHEIAYLSPGVNGVCVAAWRDPEAYAREVVRLLTDPELLARLRDGCLRSAADHTVERMAANFTAGILNALATPPLPGSWSPRRTGSRA